MSEKPERDVQWMNLLAGLFKRSDETLAQQQQMKEEFKEFANSARKDAAAANKK